jgi:hypothetical protein
MGDVHEVSRYDRFETQTPIIMDVSEDERSPSRDNSAESTFSADEYEDEDGEVLTFSGGMYHLRSNTSCNKKNAYFGGPNS